MNVNPRLKYEGAGILVLIGTGIATVLADAVVSVFLPDVTGGLVFLLIAAVVFGATVVADYSSGTQGASADPADGGILDVDLVNWANARVGTECLRCETEIEYYPLGTTEGQSEHRIECGCTVIHSKPAE